MQVKIDTKEKFHAITINESNLAANMTADLEKCLLPILETDANNVVLILKGIENVEDVAKMMDKARRAERIRRGVSVESLTPGVTGN